MRLFEKISSPRGQTTLEAALTLPILVCVIAFAIQLGWNMYCESALTSAVEHAQYSITAEEVASATDVDELLEQRIVEASPILSVGNLTVSNVTAQTPSSRIESIELPDEDFDQYRIATKNEQKTIRIVNADIDYVPLSIFNILGELHMQRYIRSSKVSSEIFELG